MVIASEQLIADLMALTQQHRTTISALKDKTDRELNWRSTDQRWNVLECLEHLNLYGEFYLPEIERRINATHSKPDERFKSGWLGNYFANSMWPKERLNNMKTFKNMNPIHRNLDRSVLTIFLEQQTHMLKLLEQARTVSLNRVKTGISISTLVKLKLGDTFRIVIYHNERHLQQIGRIFQEMEHSGKPVATYH